jgi:4-alpha-glucanotransferase
VYGVVDEPRAAGGASARRSGLDALALTYGIEPEFVDVRGDLRQTPDATKRALLSAMGVRAETEADIRASAAAQAADRWSRPLPPVIVVPPGPFEVPVVLRERGAGLNWRITYENGGGAAGLAAIETLPFVDEAERDGRHLVCRTLRIDADVPLGYHRLNVDAGGDAMALIVTPGSCWLPPAIAAGQRLSGISLSLYLLRSRHNWGIGDFTDLRAFAELVAARGGDVIGLNPLHQMFSDRPEHASPYSSASRLLLNVLNIDVTAIPEYAASEEACTRLAQRDFGNALQACRDAELVDYTTVAALKLDVLRLLYATFAEIAPRERREAFARFRAAGSPLIQRMYVFSALREHFAARDAGRAAWQDWPAEYRDPGSPAVGRFARENAAEVTFVAWLQWVADTQLELAARAAAPMRVGLYRDLAVGADPAAAETWCNQRSVVDAARVGAPPDIYNPPGQNGDLPPFDPHALRAEGYATFIELVRANMRHAGGVRIDHVMALEHLYWIPRGAPASDGAYVRYPLDDLVGILALESHRAQCLVVGEDLGTVPAGFRERMSAANILSYRVLFFERDADGIFAPPAAYPRNALAVLGSHDLPTLGAWWSGADIGLRRSIGLFSDAAAAEQQRTRDSDRDAFAAALQAAQIAAPNAGGPLFGTAGALDDDTLFRAAHTFLARTPAALAIAQIDDVTGEIEPVNVPMTSDERPNWRRRLALSLEDLAAAPRMQTLFEIFGEAGRLRAPSSARDAARGA